MEQEGNHGANAASRENQIRLAETRGKCDHKTTNLRVGRSNRSGCAIFPNIARVAAVRRTLRIAMPCCFGPAYATFGPSNRPPHAGKGES